MPLPQKPIVEWPPHLGALLNRAEVVRSRDDCCFCRIDLDVDSETLLLLNEFEAHARQHRVRLRLSDGARCYVGEMNPLVGLGAPADRHRHVAQVRISFHDLRDDPYCDLV
jgi:hypothetical protein